jgi:hypothetical protein
MWKRLRESFKFEETCAGQYIKFDFAGLHISYDRLWWFFAKQSIRGDEAIQRLGERITFQVMEEIEHEQQHASR